MSNASQSMGLYVNLVLMSGLLEDAIHFGSRPTPGTNYTIRRLDLNGENGPPNEVELVSIHEFEGPMEGIGALAAAGWKSYNVPVVKKAQIVCRWNGRQYTWRAWWPGLEGY